jgi:hypothetical protein
MRKGQITIFIIFSLVFVLLFSALFFFRSKIIEAELGPRGDYIVGQDVSFERYIQDCANRELEQIIQSLFLHGGRLPKEDAGVFNASFFREYGGRGYSYGIFSRVPPMFNISKNFKPSAPFSGLLTYHDGNPLGLFNQERSWVNYDSSFYFGTLALPKLCLTDGPNGLRFSNTALSCSQKLYGNSSDAIQAQIVSALNSRIPSCFERLPPNFDVFLKRSGPISLQFTDDSVILDLNKTVVDNKKQLEMNDFVYVFPYRLKRLYSAGYFLALFDINDIAFHKENDFRDLPSCTYGTNAPCFDSYMDVSIVKNAVGHDDLVLVHDRSSAFTYLNDSFGHLTLAFLVQNRRPYLEYVPDISVGNIGATNILLTFFFSIYDPDDNADEIYFNTGVLLKRSSDPEYQDLSGNILPVNLEKNHFNEPIFFKFSNLDFQGRFPFPHRLTGLGPLNYSMLVSSRSHCVHIRDASGADNYQNTRYYINASITDGQHDDYQQFGLEFC